MRIARDSSAEAILENVRPWPGSAELGEELRTGECSRCHGTHASGTAQCGVCGARIVGEVLQ